MMNSERSIVHASEESLSVQLLHSYKYSCVILQSELPWNDWYAILNNDGTIHAASKHCDLFDTTAEAILIEKLILPEE